MILLLRIYNHDFYFFPVPSLHSPDSSLLNRPQVFRAIKKFLTKPRTCLFLILKFFLTNLSSNNNSVAANGEKSAVATGLEKVSFHSNPKEGSCQIISNYHSIVLMSHATRLCSKSFKLGFSATWTKNFQNRLGLKKAGEQEIKLPTFVVSLRKKGESGKTSTYASLTMLKLLTVWITTNCGKFLKEWEYQTTSPASRETFVQIRKQ